MMRKPLPIQLISFYPTATIFVDDDTGYLKGLNEFLTGEKDIVPIFYNNPEQAIQYLNKSHATETWLEKCISTSYDSDEENPMVRDLQLHIDKLHQRIYDPTRFGDVSMAVLDFKMPEGSGRDFLQMISNLSIAKGILSGVMKYDEAIAGFNLKDFDVFLNKLDDNVAEDLVKYIRQAQRLYFALLSEEIVKRDPKLSHVLSNKLFCSQFQRFVDQYNIVEYYLIDNSGSFLLLDQNAKAYILAVINADDLEAFYVTANLADDKPDSDVLNAMKRHKKFPFFFNQSIGDLTPAMWGNFLLDAEQLEGTDIFYHVLNDVEKYGISLSKIKSFADCQAEHQKFTL